MYLSCVLIAIYGGTTFKVDGVLQNIKIAISQKSGTNFPRNMKKSKHFQKLSFFSRVFTLKLDEI